MIGRIWTIVRRELSSYFDQATAYILLVVFLGVNFFFFFRDAYQLGEASLRPMMGLLPWLFLFFVPAICMRTLAEEREAGTLELVLVQPIGVVEFLLGKFIGVLLFLLIAMAGTLGVPLGLAIGADLQWGVIVAQYVGSSFLLAAMVAIGLWASSMTRNQVTAFILGVTVSFVLYLIGLDIVVLGLPPWLGTIANRLGILGHFEAVARGVIDLRDVLYFVSVAGAFLALTYFALMRERLCRTRDSYRRLRIGTIGLVAVAIFVALAGGQLRTRLDLTPGKLYTLSDPTKELLEGLEDLVTIRFYRSDDLPPEYAPLRRDVEDLLRDFDAAGGGGVNLIQADPAGDEELESQASMLGISPVQFNVIGDEERSTREGYLGIALQYAGASEAIPVVQRTNDLEYRLASTIRSLTSERRPTVALLTGHGELDPATRIRLVTGRLREEYGVEELMIDSTFTAFPDTIDVVVIAGAETPLTPDEGRMLGEYLDAGGSLMVLQSGVRADQRSRTVTPAFLPVLDSLLRVRGLAIEPSLAFDLESSEDIPLQVPGGFVVQRYPVWPVAQPASDHVIVEGGNPVAYRWGSPLVDAGLDTTRVTPLLVTTAVGGALTAPASIDPEQEWPTAIPSDAVEQRVLAAAYADEEAGTRLVVAGSSQFIEDQTLTQSQYGLSGVVFFQNAIDWLAQDEALITIRSKDRSPPQILFPSALARDGVKWGNLIGVPALFVLLGIYRLARRRATQRRVFESGGAIL